MLPGLGRRRMRVSERFKNGTFLKRQCPWAPCPEWERTEAARNAAKSTHLGITLGVTRHVDSVPKGRHYRSPGRGNASAVSVDAALGTRSKSPVATTGRS